MRASKQYMNGLSLATFDLLQERVLIDMLGKESQVGFAAQLNFAQIKAYVIRKFNNKSRKMSERHQGLFERSLRLLGSTSQRKLKAHDLAIMAIDHRRQVSPAITSAGNMSHIHRPALIAVFGLASPTSHPRPRSHAPVLRVKSLFSRSTVRAFTEHPLLRQRGRFGGVAAEKAARPSIQRSPPGDGRRRDRASDAAPPRTGRSLLMYGPCSRGRFPGCCGPWRGRA